MFRNATLRVGTLLLALPIGVLARERPPALGAAIGLEYSIQHDVLRPGEDVTLLLCLTNANPHSGRDVAPGDAFSFAFPQGVVGGCGDFSVFSPDGSLSASSFACDVASNVVRLTYSGPSPTPWPVGDAVCVLVPYSVATGPSTVRAAMDVSNQGAFLAPSPAVLLLSVAPGLGTAGPPGPVGPAGPAGIPGPSGVGHWVFATSTGEVMVREHEPPVPVPGLDVGVDVAAGASLEVTVDAISVECGLPALVNRVRQDTGIAIELDGVLLAQRSIAGNSATWGSAYERGDPMMIHWISDPLAAGSHRVRVLVTAPHPQYPWSDDFSYCVGSATNDEYQARLSVKELLPLP